MKNNDQWDTSVFHNSPIVSQLGILTQNFDAYKNWPTISEYHQLFKKYKLDITPVKQATTISSFEDQYEPRVFLKKELQTRTQNWHDFFNALIWLKFPETKRTLNNLHFSQAKNRNKGTNRSMLENRITQFDECGAVIISKSQILLDMIRQHKWQELFIENREAFNSDLHCIVFGHAIFEKALSPYIGMTCHCLLLHEDELQKKPSVENTQGINIEALDLQIAEIWLNKIAHNPGRFHAFPILGIPGYWPDQKSEFYENKQYFR